MDFIPNIRIYYDFCEHLGFTLKLDTTKLIHELPLKNILGHLNWFKHASESVDQVQKLMIQNEAELNRDHKIDHIKFLSYAVMATMVAILSLIYCFS